MLLVLWRTVLGWSRQLFETLMCTHQMLDFQWFTNIIKSNPRQISILELLSAIIQLTRQILCKGLQTELLRMPTHIWMSREWWKNKNMIGKSSFMSMILICSKNRDILTDWRSLNWESNKTLISSMRVSSFQSLKENKKRKTLKTSVMPRESWHSMKCLIKRRECRKT